MTVQFGKTAISSGAEQEMLRTDDIDLRQFIRLLLDWWREILVFAIVLGVLAAIAVFILNRVDASSYEASSTVAIARIFNDITFDERYRTVSDETLSIQQSNSASRRASLLRLVVTGTIAERVAIELSSLLTSDELQIATLVKMVQASIVTGANERTESNLIRINVTANSPEKAAAIADSWAKHYVEHVNSLYGQVPIEVLQSIDDEFVVAEQGYQVAQRNLESFISTNQVRALQRQIDEKQGIINSLQAGKQTAIDTIVEEELNARRQIISAYINALASNRLLGFQKEQRSKRDVINTYLDAELSNRLAAIEEDRRVRQTLFQESADAQLAAVTSIIQEQTKGQINLLRQNYRSQLELSKILDEAKILQMQIRDAGDNGVATNDGALLLLKAQIVSIPTVSESVATQIEMVTSHRNENESTDASQEQSALPLVNNVLGSADSTRFNVDIGQPVSASADAQLADVTAFINAIKAQLSTIDQQIAELTIALVDGESHQISSLSLESLGATRKIGAKTVDDSDQSSSSATLSEALVERYVDLFNVGGLAQTEGPVPIESELLTQIEALYPELFTLGSLSQLTDNVPEDTPLALVSLEKAQQLLQLQGLEDIPEYTASAEPLIQAIGKLDGEIQLLQARLEAERSREQQLLQQRDLAWETYTTLSNKSAELNLAQNATNSEVRLAAPAVLPIEPIPGLSLAQSTIAAGIVGLLLGVFIAFFGHFLGYKPFLRRNQPSTA